MNADKLSLLREELADLEKAADFLCYSLQRTQGLLPGNDWPIGELDHLETLANRFSRLQGYTSPRVKPCQ